MKFLNASSLYILVILVCTEATSVKMGNAQGTPLGNVEGIDLIKTKVDQIINSNNTPDALKKIKEIDCDVPLNICVIGERSVGKSSFINNILGGEVIGREMTTDASSYKHPNNPLLVFWDLPGFGSQLYPDVDGYLRALHLQRYVD